MKKFIKKYPVLFYFILTFAISWGGFILALGGLSGLMNSNWQAQSNLALAIAGMLAGPTLTGIIMILLIDGKAGLKKMFSSLIKWRMKAYWYIFALLPAPLIAWVSLSTLSIPSAISLSDNKAAVLISGFIAGLTAVFEEVGWTGFAIPRLRQRFSIFTTALIVGVLWGIWHLLQQIYISGTYTGGLPYGLYLTLAILSAVIQLTGYRMLMVWLYDRTRSLLVTTLMHSSLITSTIFVFRPETSGYNFFINGILFSAGLWALVAIIFLINSKNRITNQ